MDLLVITPSRGRPERLAEMLAAIHATAALDIEVWIGLDDDDPAEYLRAVQRSPLAFAHRVQAFHGERRSLAGWTNHLAAQAVNPENPRTAPRYLASLGDDHIPRTPGWDQQLVEAIEAMDGPGWAYGNDLLQGESIPTAWVQSTELVRTLGWMMLPTCQHLCVDSAVRSLGKAAGRIAYLRDVVIEHMHPAAGKADEDDTYAESNSAWRNYQDGNAYRRWLAEDLQRDAATVRALTYAHLEA